jgi:hypothetical protein
LSASLQETTLFILSVTLIFALLNHMSIVIFFFKGLVFSLLYKVSINSFSITLHYHIQKSFLFILSLYYLKHHNFNNYMQKPNPLLQQLDIFLREKVISKSLVV